MSVVETTPIQARGETISVRSAGVRMLPDTVQDIMELGSVFITREVLREGWRKV